MSQFKDLSNPLSSSSPKNNTDHEVVFTLIDSILSLEFCLHYQVVPLKLDQNHLKVGMIDPEDNVALNFIRPIASSLGYTLYTEKIESHTHQLILAAYLKDGRISAPNKNKTNQSNSPANFSTNQTQTHLDSSLTLTEIPGQEDQPRSQPNLHDRPTLIVDQQEESVDLESDILSSSRQPQIIASEPQIHGLPFDSFSEQFNDSDPAVVLEVSAKHTKEPVDTLSALEPKQLWQELLARILDGGIGRLYLERYPDYGRIIWSRDGVIQSSLDRLEVRVFESIIKEVKTLAKQPLAPLDKPKKVAIERVYREERILLRLEFFVGQCGDEITIQVLRGNALKFYEQRQVQKSLEQAVYFAEKLEKTLRKIRMCGHPDELGDLRRLKALYSQIERQFQFFNQQNNSQK